MESLRNSLDAKGYQKLLIRLYIILIKMIKVYKDILSLYFE